MEPKLSNSDQFSEIEGYLRSILRPFEKGLEISSSEYLGYSLNTRHILPNKQPLFFAAVKRRKNYVSFYLMPVYVFPELLSGISDDLRKRMQGRSCFNFKQPDQDLFEELAELTRTGYERYRAEGYLE